MKRQILVLTMATLMAVTMTACGGGAQSGTANMPQAQEGNGDNNSGEEIVKIRMASTVSTNELEARSTGMSAGLMTWIDTVEAESGGSIQVELFADGQLASGTDSIVNGIQTGAFEASHFNTGSWATYTDAFAELNVPYLYSDLDDVHKVLDGEIGDAMKAKLEKDVPGVKALSYIDIGFRQVTSSREIHSVADMKGLKIRTMDDKLQIACMENMGAAVTSVPITELYSALQTGMVDAQENPLSTIDSQKFYEVNPYCCLTNHSYTSTFVFMNADIYNKLSDNQKAAIDKANAACTIASKKAAEEAENTYRNTLTEKGMTIYEPTEAEMKEFREVASACWPQARELMGEERYNVLMAALGVN